MTEIQTTLSPGTFVSHYQIISLAGAGGMGVVYKALDQRRNCRVCIDKHDIFDDKYHMKGSAQWIPKKDQKGEATYDVLAYTSTCSKGILGTHSIKVGSKDTGGDDNKAFLHRPVFASREFALQDTNPVVRVRLFSIYRSRVGSLPGSKP